MQKHKYSRSIIAFCYAGLQSQTNHRGRYSILVAIKFVSIQKSLGFDPAPDASSNPVPFQMVPRYGARGMILHNAPKHTVELIPSGLGKAGTGKFVEVPGPNPNEREIWVSGFTEGTMFLSAKNPTTNLSDARMECFIAERKKVRVGFYVVKDSAGRKSKIFTAAKAKAMVEGADDIHYYQANVVIEFAFAKEPFPEDGTGVPDLGATPMVDSTMEVLDKLIKSRIEANFHVFLLWAMEDSTLGQHGMTPLGFSNGATCLIKNTANPYIIMTV